MSELSELIKRVGEPYDSERHLSDFGIESAEKVADFYNNGGLEFHNEGDWNFAVQYASVEDGRVQVGSWVWGDDEDFDQDATFEIYDEEDFSEREIQAIIDRIKSIYGTR